MEQGANRSNSKYWLGCCGIISLIILGVGACIFYGAYSIVVALSPSRKIIQLSATIDGTNSLVQLAELESIPYLVSDSIKYVLPVNESTNSSLFQFKDHGSVYSGIGFDVHLIQKTIKSEWQKSHDFYLSTIQEGGSLIDYVIFASYHSDSGEKCSAYLNADLQVVRSCNDRINSVSFNLLQDGTFEYKYSKTEALRRDSPKIRIRKIGG